MEMKFLPLKASAKSAASTASRNFIKTILLLGEESLGSDKHRTTQVQLKGHLIIRRCVMPSAAGATKLRKSEGVMYGGTARTARRTPCAVEPSSRVFASELVRILCSLKM
jgi:hypothetical protein